MRLKEGEQGGKRQLQRALVSVPSEVWDLLTVNDDENNFSVRSLSERANLFQPTQCAVHGPLELQGRVGSVWGGG